MKPIYLKMTAFGPFATSQSVAFDELGENPLFLINGPTGAGKTSLLDAMAFALYGVTTGDRSGESMRCHHAANDLETEVIFIFALGKKYYRIDRKPAQTTKAKRGDGDASRNATANLYAVQPDHNLAPLDWPTELLSARSVTQASEQIKTLIGLDASQFRQVVVLPQGRFRELLVASSQDREKILASLFQTQIFKNIEEAVAAKARNVHNAYHQLKQNLASLVADAGVETIEQLEAEIEQAQEPLQQAKEELANSKLAHDQAKTAYTQAVELNKRFDSLIDNQRKFEQLRSQQATINEQRELLQQHRHATQLQPTWQELQKATEQLKARTIQQQHATEQLSVTQKAVEQATADCAKVKNHPEQIDGLKAQLNTLAKQADLVEQLQSLQNQRRENSDKLQQYQQKLTQVTAEQADIDAKVAASEAQQQALQTQIEQHQNTEVAVQKLERQIAQAHKLAEQETVITAAQAQLQQAEQPVQAAREQLEQAKTTHKRLQLQWHSEQAHALALQLEPGLPCLVCGSTEHPNPAHANSDQELVSQEQLEQAEQHIQRQQTALQSAEQHYAKQQQQIQHRIEMQTELRTELGELGELGELAQQPVPELQRYLQQQLQDMQAVATRQLSEKTQLAQVTQTLQKLSQLKTTLTKQAGEQQQLFNDCATVLARLTGQIDSLDPEQSLQKMSVQDIQEQLKTLRRQCEKLQLEQEQAQARLRQSEQQLATAKNGDDSARKELQDSQASYTSAQQAWQKALASAPWDNEQAFLAALLSADKATLIEQALADYQSQLIATESQIKQDQDAIAQQQRPDLSVLEAYTQEQAQREHASQQTFDTLDKGLHLLQYSQQRYRNQEAKSKELVSEYKIIGELAETLSGDNDARVSLQRFVLAVLLDDVLHEASLRLEQMTHHRYTLLRGQDTGDRRKHGGLDLMINDSYTGQNREVNTLSGGESFMAALALALGLSDVVQSYAGGIRIETLFIDEGFGSLDSEALDLAIDVLANLRASGRTIGIISHVGELKQRIHKRIDVVRQADGSYLKMQ